MLGDALNARGASSSGGRLSRRTPTPTDTLAKLLWSLDQLTPAPGALPDQMGSPAGSDGGVTPWVHAVGPRTLVLIDEAGMASTAELARAVAWAISRGGSVRLVGDDAQPAAVGAGGVLRDLAHTHGAVRLEQVVRFHRPGRGRCEPGAARGRPELARASTSTTSGSTSVTRPQPPTRRSPPGKPTAHPAGTACCSPPPATPSPR